tara:strand:+ start:528 stop:1184 length:657 start_codon:yes stop_codon:yes gene_type:complete
VNNYKHPLINVCNNIEKNSCPNFINFHCHTIFSDGSLHPIDLFKQANSTGLQHLAITDHHSNQAYMEIYNYLKDCPNHTLNKTKIWTGVEITSTLKGCLVHILALGFDHSSNHLNPYLNGDSVKGNDLLAHTVVSRIKSAGGISFLAHPARYRLGFKELIEEASHIGIDGIEVWYDYERSKCWRPTPLLCDQISMLTTKHNMLHSCGTDSHGYSLLTR